jgi:hypothetical protein
VAKEATVEPGLLVEVQAVEEDETPWLRLLFLSRVDLLPAMTLPRPLFFAPNVHRLLILLR